MYTFIYRFSMCIYMYTYMYASCMCLPIGCTMHSFRTHQLYVRDMVGMLSIHHVDAHANI